MSSPPPMDPIDTLIVDDEPEAREGMLALLRDDPEIRIVGEARTGAEAVGAIEARRPDLVFLDVQMPQLDGFGVLEALGPASPPVVVFVTAYDEYALRAFDARALDYLLKPFSDARFAEALGRAKDQVRQRRVGQLGRRLAAVLGTDVEAGNPPPPGGRRDESPPERLVVRSGKDMAFVKVEDIDWIEARNYCAKLHVRGQTYVIRETMKALSARLDPERFVRIHRSTIVNLDRVRSLEAYFHGSYMVVLHDGTKLTLSRSRRSALERALGHGLR